MGFTQKLALSSSALTRPIIALTTQGIANSQYATPRDAYFSFRPYFKQSTA